MQDSRRLNVWQEAHQLALAAYRATHAFPDEERYGLASQMRRCSVSIASNIAEGCGRGTDADFARFLHIAMGSASEFEYQTLLAADLGYLDADERASLASSAQAVKRMLAALLKRLNQRADLQPPTADS